jgi:outer membrane protein OmpA-like peptidoglycan-associated protein
MPTAHATPRLVALALAAGLAACAHEPNANLARAEAEYRAAASDPLVLAHAPLLLEDARRALERGQRAQRSDDDVDEVDHLAYLASRRVEIARVAAERDADVARADELSRSLDPVVIVEPPRVPPATVEEVYFAPERSRLPDGARAELARVADVLEARPERWVRVEGHADETEREGRRLSEERAAEVARALIDAGVEPERISVRGFGASEPAAASVTDGGRQLNRRVEIYLTPVVGAR